MSRNRSPIGWLQHAIASLKLSPETRAPREPLRRGTPADDLATLRQNADRIRGNWKRAIPDLAAATLARPPRRAGGPRGPRCPRTLRSVTTAQTALPTSVQVEPELCAKLRVRLAHHPDLQKRLKPDSPARWVYLYLISSGTNPVYLYHLTTRTTDVRELIAQHTHGEAVFGQNGHYNVGNTHYRAVLGMPDVPGSRSPGHDGLAAF